MKKTTFLSTLCILTISVVVFHAWLSFSAFSAVDWSHRYSEKLAENIYPTTWTGFASLGGGSVEVWKYPVRFVISGMFGLLGFDWNVVDKFLFFWHVIFLFPIIGYMLLRKLGLSPYSAAIGSLIISLNSYFLSIYTQGHVPLANGGIFGLLMLYFLIRMREEGLAVWAVLAGMMLAVAGYYDFRFAYIFLGVAALYFLWEWWGVVCPHLNPLPGGEEEEGGWIPARSRNDREGNRYTYGEDSRLRGNDRGLKGGGFLKLFGMFVVVFVGLNVFWVLPFGAAGAVGTENGAMGRGLFGNDQFELEDAMYLSHPYWTGYGVEWFRDHTAPWWLSVLGVLAWVGFWVGRKNRMVVFFALLSVIGILLGKQVAEPWGNLYYFLYDHLPGFNAFREASKFYILVVLGYSVGIGALVERILIGSNSQLTTHNSQQGRERAGNKQQREKGG